ncbi:MAG: hypothetical protein ACE5J4_02680 [Candidatus Aenigmatarchaeota archaeon]
MTFLRSLAVFFLSSLFVVSSVSAITSYTMKDVVDKENLKNFIRTELIPSVIEEGCNQTCAPFNETEKTICLDECRREGASKTEELVDKGIDDIYNQQILNTNFNEFANFLKTFFIPLIILSVIFVGLIFFASKSPLYTLGHNFISVAISCFIIGFIPNLITLPQDTYIQAITGYVYSGLQQQIYFGIAFLIGGIILLIIHHKKK